MKKTISKKSYSKVALVVTAVMLFFACGMQMSNIQNSKAYAASTYTFNYQIIGKTHDLGERLSKVVIDTGNLELNPTDITTATFLYEYKSTVLWFVTTTKKAYPESVNVNGNIITLTFKQTYDDNLPGILDSNGGLGSSTSANLKIEQNIGSINKSSITLKAQAIKSVNQDVDIFTADSVVTASGATVPYRLFTPNNSEANAPLIVWMNTASETGTDNRIHVANVPIVELTTPSVQSVFGANGAYVMAPQSPDLITMGNDAKWGAANMANNFKAAIDDVVASNNVDPNRIYICGGSQGGGATFTMITTFPNFFAAAVECSTYFTLRDAIGGDKPVEDKLAAVKAIADTGLPIFFLHSINDGMPTNPVDGSIQSWIDYTAAGGEGYLSLFDGVGVYVEGNTTDIAHNTWLHLLHNYNGSETNLSTGEKLLIEGTGVYSSQTYGEQSYTSIKPSDAAGNYANILSWMAAQVK